MSALRKSLDSLDLGGHLVSALGPRPGDLRRVVPAFMVRARLVRDVALVDSIGAWDSLEEASTADAIGLTPQQVGQATYTGAKARPCPDDFVEQGVSGLGSGSMERVAGRTPGIGLRVPILRRDDVH